MRQYGRAVTTQWCAGESVGTVKLFVPVSFVLHCIARVWFLAGRRWTFSPDWLKFRQHVMRASIPCSAGPFALALPLQRWWENRQWHQYAWWAVPYFAHFIIIILVISAHRGVEKKKQTHRKVAYLTGFFFMWKHFERGKRKTTNKIGRSPFFKFAFCDRRKVENWN